MFHLDVGCHFGNTGKTDLRGHLPQVRMSSSSWAKANNPFSVSIWEAKWKSMEETRPSERLRPHQKQRNEIYHEPPPQQEPMAAVARFWRQHDAHHTAWQSTMNAQCPGLFTIGAELNQRPFHHSRRGISPIWEGGTQWYKITTSNTCKHICVKEKKTTEEEYTSLVLHTQNVVRGSSHRDTPI